MHDTLSVAGKDHKLFAMLRKITDYLELFL